MPGTGRGRAPRQAGSMSTTSNQFGAVPRRGVVFRVARPNQGPFHVNRTNRTSRQASKPAAAGACRADHGLFRTPPGSFRFSRKCNNREPPPSKGAPEAAGGVYAADGAAGDGLRARTPLRGKHAGTRTSSTLPAAARPAAGVSQRRKHGLGPPTPPRSPSILPSRSSRRSRGRRAGYRADDGLVPCSGKSFFSVARSATFPGSDSSIGVGNSSRKARDRHHEPGVQKPHCKACLAEGALVPGPSGPRALPRQALDGW